MISLYFSLLYSWLWDSHRGTALKTVVSNIKLDGVSRQYHLMRLTAELITARISCHWFHSFRMRSKCWQCSSDRYPMRPCAFCADITQRQHPLSLHLRIQSILNYVVLFWRAIKWLSYLPFSSAVWSLKEAVHGCSSLFIILPKNISICIWIDKRLTKSRVLQWWVFESKESNHIYLDHYLFFLFLLNRSPFCLAVHNSLWNVVTLVNCNTNSCGTGSHKLHLLFYLYCSNAKLKNVERLICPAWRRGKIM